MMTRPLLLLALLTGLAACGSDPVHYHTLQAATAPVSSAVPAGFQIDVLPVGVPAQLDQAQLVVRRGESGAAVLDGERWTGPLGDEMRSALSAGLAARLGTQDVAGLAVAGGPKVMRVRVQLRRLDAWLGQSVAVEAGWSLGFADEPDARLACAGRFMATAPGGYPALTGAAQRAVGDLASRIAADARVWFASRSAGCTG